MIDGRRRGDGSGQSEEMSGENGRSNGGRERNGAKGRGGSDEGNGESGMGVKAELEGEAKGSANEEKPGAAEAAARSREDARAEAAGKLHGQREGAEDSERRRRRWRMASGSGGGVYERRGEGSPTEERTGAAEAAAWLCTEEMHVPEEPCKLGGDGAASSARGMEERRSRRMCWSVRPLQAG